MRGAKPPIAKYIISKIIRRRVKILKEAVLGRGGGRRVFIEKVYNSSK